MAVTNVQGWRNDPDQVVSELAARLLTWMTRGHSGSAVAVEDVAAEIETGLREMVGASSGLLLGRVPATTSLQILAAGGDLALQPQPAIAPALEAAPLLHSLPEEACFASDPPQALQLPLAELFAWLRDCGALREVASGTAQDDAPGLVVPLRSLTTGGELEVSAVGLFWIATQDGMLPGFLQPALHGAAGQAGAWLATATRSERLGRSYRQLAEMFGDVSDGKEPHKAGHAAAVAYYAGLIARGLNLPESEIQAAEFAALLHSIGKIGVPDSILQKGAALSDQELNTIRASALIGSQWLSEVEGLREVAAIVRHQGERYDGSGYPDGLRGDDIPIGARILAVAMRFSAMTKPRADRGPMSVVGGALESVANDTDGALDPSVVQAFLAVMGRRLSGGRTTPLSQETVNLN